jgi:hypothetical protein
VPGFIAKWREFTRNLIFFTLMLFLSFKDELACTKNLRFFEKTQKYRVWFHCKVEKIYKPREAGYKRALRNWHVQLFYLTVTVKSC